MIERFLRWFAKYRDLEERLRVQTAAAEGRDQARCSQITALTIERDGLKEQVEAYKTAIREMGIERSFLQDRYIQTKEELRALQQDLLTILKQSFETSRPHSGSSFDPARPVLPARAQVYRKVAEQNREFYQDLEKRLDKGGEVKS